MRRPWHTRGGLKTLRHAAFTAVPICFFFSYLPTYLNYEQHVCICTYLTAYRLYMNYRCYQITLQWNIFTQIGAVRRFDWIFIVGAQAWWWRWVGQYVTLGRTLISVINQLDTQNFSFTISLFRASAGFVTPDGCITLIQFYFGVLVHETATYRCDDTRDCVMQFRLPDDEHICSKHVEAWNKLIVKQKFCASSWLITEINILRCTVSKTSKNCTERFTVFNRKQ